MVIEFCEENPNGTYEDLLNKIEVLHNCTSQPPVPTLSPTYFSFLFFFSLLFSLSLSPGRQLSLLSPLGAQSSLKMLF